MPHHQPKAYDVVLGSQTPTPVSAAVLGGIAGVKRRFASANIAQRVAALQETSKYGQAGLELAFSALQDKAWQVRQTAYLLLQSCEDAILQEAFQADNPYQLLRCLHRHPTPKFTAYTVAISPNGQILISGGSDRVITVRSLYSGKIIRTFSGHTDGIKSIAITPSGQTIISASWDNTIKIWNLQNQGSYGGAIPQKKISDSGLLYTLIPHSDTVNCIAISPNSHILATGSDDFAIELWNLQTPKLITAFTAHQDAVKSIAISPDGNLLASASADSTIKIWHLETGELLHTLAGHTDWVKCVAISPDSKILVSGAQDKTIKLWNLQTGELLNTLIGHWGEINSIAIGSDGHTLISGSWDRTMRIWHLRTGTQLQILEGHHDAIAAVAITPDGSKIVSSSWDRTIAIWGAR
ncbi:MAG TPA: WD40 repeat domain-containing protein [Leptolyngbyaceae cyanobacterium]